MTSSTCNLKCTLGALCVAGTFLACTTAQAGWTTWNNSSGDGKWETAANWSAGAPTYSSQAPIIGSLATAGPVTASSGTYSFTYMRVGVEATHPIGKLIVSGADLTSGGTNTRNGFGYGSGNSGTLDISSGSLTFNNNTNNTSIGSAGATSGTVNQTGGTLRFAGGTGTSVSMGTTNGAGLFNFTAGTLETREGFTVFTAGTGTSVFHVNGYDASSSIQIGGTSDDYNGAWEQATGATLSISVDGGTAQGSTLINVGTGTNGTKDGKATFASGSFLDLDFKSGAQSGTWTILSAAGGITDNGLAFASGVDTDVWSFGITGNDLWVTAAVPEPSAFALIMGGSALLLIGGRRRRS